MKISFRYIIAGIVLFVLIACNNTVNPKRNPEPKPDPEKPIFRTGLQKINFKDTCYSQLLSSSATDFITESGYKVEYRVYDSSKCEDLYIVWSKGDFCDTFQFPSVLMFQDYEYIPINEDETKDYIFMYYDCAQMDCAAYILLNKDTLRTAKQFISLYANIKEHSFLLYGQHSIDFPSNDMNLFNYATDDTLKIDLGQEFFYDSCKVDGKNLFLYLHQSDENRTIINKVVKRVNLKN
jgi:hypothetical protein